MKKLKEIYFAINYYLSWLTHHHRNDEQLKLYIKWQEYKRGYKIG